MVDSVEALKLNSDEEIIWRWALKNGYSLSELSKFLKESRIESISRFFSSYFREFYTDHVFIQYSTYSNKYIDEYCSVNQLTPEKIVIMNFIDSVSELIVFIEKEYTLGKFIISAFPVVLRDNSIHVIDDIQSLIDCIVSLYCFKSTDISKLLADFRLSSAQYFLSKLLRIQNLSDNKSLYTSIINFNFKSDKESMLEFFEQWCIRGHLLHPIPKLKSNLSLEELLHYSPEAKSTFTLDIAAVPRTLATFHHDLSKTYDDYMKEIYCSFYDDLKNAMNSMDLSWENYYIIPIHPWQCSHILTSDINENFEKNSLKLLTNIDIKASPLISFRSLHFKNSHRFLKLPVNIQITSAKRHLSPRACHHAIYISDIISRIKSTNGVSQNFEFEKEDFSIHLSYHIGVIYRQGLSTLLEDNHIIMPAASFYESSPINENQCIIDDIISFYARNNNTTDFRKALKDFFTGYVNLVTSDVVKLLTVYGIGMEGHLQNCMIAFKDFFPSKIILRDGEAINVCVERLKLHFPDHKFYPGSWNVAEGPEDCQDVVMHSIFHSNIGQLILHFSETYGFEEAELWKDVRIILQTQLKNIKDTFYCSNAIEDEEYFFNSQTNIKCLFKMRIIDSSNTFIHSKLKNPLCSD